MAPPKVPRQDAHILRMAPTPLSSRDLLSDGPDTTNTILIAVASVLGAATMFFFIALFVYRRRVARHRMIESQFVAVQRKNDHFNHPNSPNSPNSPVPTGAPIEDEEGDEKRLSTIQEEGAQGGAQGAAQRGVNGHTHQVTSNSRGSYLMPGVPQTLEELRKWSQDAMWVTGAREPSSQSPADIELKNMPEMRRDDESYRGRSLTTKSIGTAISC